MAAMRRKKTLTANKRLSLESLESREMLDASGDWLPSVISTDRPIEVAAATPVYAEIAQMQRHEVIVIDGGVADADVLIDSLKSTRSGVDWTVISLSSSREGLPQMAEALSGMTNVDALHWVSHGSPGQIQLGSDVVTASGLAEHRQELRAIAQSLTPDADILIYGCEVGATPAGQKWLNELATLTSADVAASDDLTGDRLQGGDWQLEVAVGRVETPVAFGDRVQESYGRVLAGSALGGAEGVVAVDLNGNGTADSGEGVSGASIQVYLDDGDGTFSGTSDSLESTVTTNSSGRYLASGLTAGDYFIVQQAQTVGGHDLPMWVSGLRTISGDGVEGALVDSFDGDYGPVTDWLPAGTPMEENYTASVAIGGERDLQAEILSSVGSNAVDLETNGGLLDFKSDFEAIGQYTVTWDGMDSAGNGLNPTGLGGVDLTQIGGTSGLSHGICLTRVATDQPGGSIEIRVYSSATEYSQATLSMLPGDTVDRDYFFSFGNVAGDATFSDAGSNGGADFTNVGAVRLVIAGSQRAMDGHIDAVAAYGLSTVTSNVLNAADAGMEITKEVCVNENGPCVASNDAHWGNSTEFIADLTPEWRITLENTGDVELTADVTDVLPTGMTFVSGSAMANGNTSGFPTTWTSTVSAGQQAVLTFTTQATTPLSTSSFTNTVNFTADDASGNEVDSGSDTASVTYNPAAAVSLVKDVCLNDAGPCDPTNDSHWGQSATLVHDTTPTWRVTLENTGQTVVTASVTDTLPTGMSYVSGSASGSGDLTSFPSTWAATVAPGTSEVITFDTSLNSTPANGDSFTNSVHMTGSDQFGNSFDESDDATATYGVAEMTITNEVCVNEAGPCDLAIDAHWADSATYSTDLTPVWRVILDNTGGVDLTATVADMIPAGSTYVSGSAITNTGATVSGFPATWMIDVAAGEQASLMFETSTTMPLSASPYVNTASFTSVDGSGTAASSGLDTASVTYNPAAAVSLVKDVCLNDAGPCDPTDDSHWGQWATLVHDTMPTWRVTLENTGQSVVTASVTDTLPTGMSYVSGSASGSGDLTSFPSTWAATVAPGTSEVITFDTSLNSTPANGDSFTNSVHMTGSDQFGNSFDESDDATATYAVAEMTITNQVCVNEAGPCDLAVDAHWVDSATYSTDLTPVWRVILDNTGGVDLTATVADMIPAGSTYVSGSAITNTGAAVPGFPATWMIDVSAGEQASLMFETSTTLPLSTSPYVNTASFTSVDGSGIAASSGSDTASVTYDPTANLTIVKEACLNDGAPCDPAVDAHWGQSATLLNDTTPTWRVQLNNAGISDFTATVTDTATAGMSYVSGSAVGNGDVTSFFPIWTVDVAAGTTEVLTFDTSIDSTPSVGDMFTNSVSLVATDGFGNTVNASDDADVTFASVEISMSKEVCVNENGPCEATTDSHWADTAVFRDDATPEWRITISNTGTLDLGTSVVDSIPAGMSYVAGSASIVGGGETTGFPSSWSSTSNAGADLVLTFATQLDTADANITPYVNNVALTATDMFGNTYDETATAQIEYLTSEIGLTKAVRETPTELENGNFRVPYRLVVMNTGPVPLTNVNVSDDLFSQLGQLVQVLEQPTISDGPSMSGSVAPNLIAYDGGVSGSSVHMFDGTSGVLVPGDSLTIDLAVEVPGSLLASGQVLLNQATASGVGDHNETVTDLSDDGFDPTGTNPDAPGDQGTPDDPTPVAIPTIGVAKQVRGIPARNTTNSAHYDVTFDVVIQNTGPLTLHGIDLVEDIAQQWGAAFVGVASAPMVTSNTLADPTLLPTVNSAWAGDSQSMLNDDGSLEPGEQVSLSFAATFDSEAFSGQLMNQVQVTADDPFDGSEDGPVDLSDDGPDPVGTNPDRPVDSGGSDDPTPVEVPDATVGVAKKATVTGDATQTTLTIILQHYGNVTAESVSVMEDLDSVFGSGTYEVANVQLMDGPASLVLNGHFNGGADAELIDAVSTMQPGDTAEIQVIVNLTNVQLGLYYNQVTSTTTDENGELYRDDSQDGCEPDLNGNNDPTDDYEPTPIPVAAGEIHGRVYGDFNNNGVFDTQLGELPIEGVTVMLTGSDVYGNPIELTTYTQADGSYEFLELLPGDYTVMEVHPENFVDGIDTLGDIGGTIVDNDKLEVPLQLFNISPDGLIANNYDFGERGIDPAYTGKNPFLVSSLSQTGGVLPPPAPIAITQGDFTTFSESILSGMMTVYGTTGTDKVTLTVKDGSYRAVVNQVAHEFELDAYTGIRFVGLGGDDSVQMIGTEADDHAVLMPHAGYLQSDSYLLWAEQTTSMSAVGMGGDDNGFVVDSAANDVFLGAAQFASMRAVDNSYRNVLRQFEKVTGNASGGGHDIAIIYDSWMDDHFLSVPGFAMMTGGNYQVRAAEFEHVEARATSFGTDTAEFRDSLGNDSFESTIDMSMMRYSSGDRTASAIGFESVESQSRSGDDIALFDDLQSSDLLQAAGRVAEVERGAHRVRVSNFSTVRATADENETPRAQLDAIDFLFDQIGDWS